MQTPSTKQFAVLGAVVTMIFVASLFALRMGTVPMHGTPPTTALSGARHERIAEEGILEVHLPFAMDEESVEEHLTVTPKIEGGIEWKDAQTLAFRPSSPLTQSGTYTVTVAPEALRKNRAVLGRPVVVSYFVAGAPNVSQRIPPPESQDVGVDQEITVVFDRPMVALTTLSEREGQMKDMPLSLHPPIDGTWKWISTTTLQFQTKQSFAPGTKYQVNVPAGIPTLSGETTKEDFSWSFTTPLPFVVQSEPFSGFTSASQKTQIVLTFNQDVDLGSVEHHTQLVQAVGGKALPDTELEAMRDASPSPDVATTLQKKCVYGTKDIDGKKITDKKTVVVIPASPLPWNTWHGIIVDDGVLSPGGSLGSPSAFTTTFRTAGAMELTDVHEEYGAIVLSFSNPYDGASIKNGISITPKPEGWEEMTFEENLYDSNMLYLYPNVKPSTQYSVQATVSLKDSFGQKATPGKPFTFKTAPISPKVFIHGQRTFGVFERGFAPVYYLNAVNVKKMDVGFAKLSLKEFLEEQQKGRYDWQHVPAIAGKEMEHHWTVEPKSAPNTWKSIALDLEEKLGMELPTGIYVLTLSAPEYKDEYSGKLITEKIYFTVSRTALVFKQSDTQALVWAIDMETGKPVSGAKIAMVDLNGDPHIEGITDKDGFFETTMDETAFAYDGNTWNPEIWVTASTAEDFAFVGSTWNSGMTPWDFGFGEDYGWNGKDYQLMGFAYTDRPIYKAGDTVYFKGILRLRDQRGTLLPPKSSRRARITIRDAEWNTIYDESLPISALGSFHGKLPLDAKASLGGYNIDVSLEPTDDIGGSSTSTSFQVLAYRKPEYRVETSFDREEYFAGDTVRATITGAYYFGMPLADAQVTWRAMSTDYFFNRYTDGWYNFSPQTAWCWYDCTRSDEMLSSGEGKLSSEGTLSVSIPVPLEKKDVSQILSLDVDITDPSNQVVSSRTSVPVHTASLYVGIRPEEYAVEPGKEATVHLITLKTDGTPVGGTRVDLTLFKRTWTTTRKKGIDGQYTYDNQIQDDKFSTFSATTGSDGKAVASVKIPAGGEWSIQALVHDSAGHAATSDTSVYAWSSSYVNWPHTNSSRMTVLADKPEYNVGDTAKLLIQSPYQGKGVQALVTIEREGIIRRTVVPIESSAQSIEIPVTEDLLPNAYVSVVVVKSRIGETFNEHGLDTGAPGFRIGYVKLKVHTTAKKLTVSLTPDKHRYVPGETVTMQIATEDSTGNPVSAEVSLAVVDMSLLALTGYEIPNLIAAFYSDRGLGVSTAVNLLYLLERFKPGSKGGGGDIGETKVRGEFKDTAYWNPSITTDTKGRATITFKLPDNLTTWKATAIAHTKESLVGAGDTEFLETKHVILRPVRPRFGVIGDKAILGAIVHNGTEHTQEFTVSLKGTGFEGSVKPQTVSVPAEGKVKVNFPVTFLPMEKAEFAFRAQSQGFEDEVRESIPLLPFGIEETVATAGMTENATEEHIFVPVREEVSGLVAEATLSPTLATYLPRGLQYLVQFPYGCAEQTTSSFLPNIAVAKLQGFDAFHVVSDTELKDKVTVGIERLLTFQRNDGGFGYWNGSHESMPYLSAYILHALFLAKEAGFPSGEAITKARTYLEDTLRNRKEFDPIDLSQRTYILYVLGETGSPDAALLSNIYGKRKDLSLFSQAYLAMALQKVGDDRRASAILKEILEHAHVSPRGVQFEERDHGYYRSLMSTNSRTTAIILQALLKIDPTNALAPNIVRGMLTSRINGRWDTTQSTTASIMALVDYLKVTHELEGKFTATLQANATEIGQAAFDATNILTKKEVSLPRADLTPGAFNTLQIAKEGPGRLYYDLVMSYFWKTDKIEASDEGISIARTITPIQGSPKDPKTGGTYKVRLTITVPETRHFVAVESPHPAGFEGIDFALQTSQKYLEDQLNTSREERYWWWDSSWVFSHKEFRDDQVFLFADTLSPGVYHYEYLVRATLPGTYRWRPARAYEMYFPEVFGNTESSIVTIRDGDS